MHEYSNFLWNFKNLKIQAFSCTTRDLWPNEALVELWPTHKCVPYVLLSTAWRHFLHHWVFIGTKIHITGHPDFFKKYSLPCAPWCTLRLGGAYPPRTHTDCNDFIPSRLDRWQGRDFWVALAEWTEWSTFSAFNILKVVGQVVQAGECTQTDGRMLPIPLSPCFAKAALSIITKSALDS